MQKLEAQSLPPLVYLLGDHLINWQPRLTGEDSPTVPPQLIYSRLNCSLIIICYIGIKLEIPTRTHQSTSSPYFHVFLILLKLFITIPRENVRIESKTREGKLREISWFVITNILTAWTILHVRIANTRVISCSLYRYQWYCRCEMILVLSDHTQICLTLHTDI